MGKANFLFDRFIFSGKLPVDKRVFNLVAGFGFIASLTALLVHIIEGATLAHIIFISLLLFILVLFLIYCNIYRSCRLGTMIAIVICCNIVFPLAFFASGGAGGGMAGYFVLSMVFPVMLMHGPACVIMLAFNIAVIIACYAVDYFFPGVAAPVFSPLARHVDNVNAYLITGLFIGVLIKFQAKIHIEEKEKAEAASEAKGAFLASVSHAIRTPLNAIMGFSELQLRKDKQGETQQNLEKIYDSGLTLLNIINDILDISRIESGKFQLTNADYEISRVINDTIALNIVRIGSKNINFIIEIDEDMPSVLHGDELRIKQILNNILSNAFKYTNEGDVRLKIKCERDCKLAWITVSVQDSGIGIRQEDIGKLFTDFKQIHMRGEVRQEGTGLGLPIAKNLTEMMGGTIMVDSEYGKGSTFTIVFPQGIVNPAPIGKEVAESLSSRSFTSHSREKKHFEYDQMPYARVLIVDDVEINLMVAESMMKPYGLSIDCVSSGKEAVRRIMERKISYDAVFMDHMMPEMDGIEAVRIIREEIGTEYAARIPIIALTANALVGNEEMFLAKGFQAFLSKPIDGARLDDILKKFVRRPRNGSA